MFKASTNAGKSLGIRLDTLDLPQGAQLSYFVYEYDNSIIYKTHGCQRADLANGLSLSSFGYNEMYIEYFEPKDFDKIYDFKIIGWIYDFALKKEETTPKLYAGVELKSRVYFSANIKPMAVLITKRILPR